MACKALRALAAAEGEVGAEYLGFRTGFTCTSVKWEDVTVETARAMGVGQMHLGVVQAFCTVVECGICLREGLGRRADVRMSGEGKGGEGMEGEVGEGECVGRRGGEEEDKMEVDSAYAV